MKINTGIGLIIIFVFHAIVLMAQDAPVSTISTIHTYETTISVPVTAIQFTNVSSCNLQFFYDHSVMMATSVDLGPQMPGMISFNINTPGVITIGWFTWMGVTRPDHSTIFELTFSKNNGGISAITWNNDYPDRNWFSGNLVIMNDIPPEEYYYNGSAGFLSLNAPLTTAAEINACPAGLVEVPVTVANFNNIGSVFLTLLYDPLSISYNSCSNNSGFPNLISQETEPGTIQISGIVPPPPSGTSGFSLTDDDILFTLYFTYLSGSSNLVWLSNGSACEYKTWPDYLILNQNPASAYYFNGSVAVPSLNVSCPEPIFIPSCTSPEAISSAFSSWIGGFGYNGGCNPTATNLENFVAPDQCGGSLTIDYAVTDEAGQSQSCISSFTVEVAPPVVLNCATDVIIIGENQNVIDGLFQTWLSSTTFSGGCNSTLTNNNTGAPPSSGGATIVTWNLSSLCEDELLCTATFTVIPAFSVIPAHSFIRTSLNPPISYNNETIHEGLKQYSLQQDLSLNIHPQYPEYQKTTSNYIETPNPDKSDKTFQFKVISSQGAQAVDVEYYQPEVGESIIEVIAVDGKQFHKVHLPVRPQGNHNHKMQINAGGIILFRMIFSSAYHTETLTKKIYINY